jgi:hypothetical protein
MWIASKVQGIVMLSEVKHPIAYLCDFFEGVQLRST